jgi:DNA-binding MarR family transcriptional regulator/N-acetylglutamate synthase-like GNAT family acetyltransferase
MSTPTHSSLRPAGRSPAPRADQIESLRAFNRFYTRRVGVLVPYPDSGLSLAEVRVLYELAQARGTDEAAPSASALGLELGLDAGYLSRILQGFEARGWLTRARSAQDARRSELRLTQAGRSAFAPLREQARKDAQALLAPLPEPRRARLVDALASVQALLEAPAASDSNDARPSVVLRDPRPGDLGWVVQQHGELYAREYGFNAEFEALVADLVARYVRRHQPEWERCWIAELAGERVGAVFVVRKSKTVAQLRMLILAPAARGHGIGARLTDECLHFARAKGYRKMMLWTNSCLTAARAIYAQRGFQLVKSEAYTGFGQPLVSEIWELVL